ncbi:MAG: GGDEF domain-containing protein, partial [Microthrixaceae bacterium]
MTDARTQIHRVTGEFVDEGTEHRYRLDEMASHAQLYGRIATGIAIAIPLYAVMDELSLGIGATWWWLVAARCVATLGVLELYRRLRSDPLQFAERRGLVVVAAVQAIVFAVVILAGALRPQDAATSALSLAIIVLGATVIVPGRFRVQLGSAVAAFAAFVVMSRWRFHDPEIPVVPLVSNLLLTLVWGVAILSITNRGQRRRWSAVLAEQDTNRRLHDELEHAAELRRELQQLARQDALTGAANRREFLRVAQEHLRDRRGGDGCSVLLLDVDRFKAVNDSFGHAAGDVALVHLVRSTNDVIRAEDLVARLGGEEFAVLLPGADTSRAIEVADRVRAGIAMDSRSDISGPLTVSIGVATARSGDTVESILARADAAMYQVKRRGGNGVDVGSDTEVEERTGEIPESVSGSGAVLSSTTGRLVRSTAVLSTRPVEVGSRPATLDAVVPSRFCFPSRTGGRDARHRGVPGRSSDPSRTMF